MNFTVLWGSSWLWPGPWFNIKMSSYQYRKSNCGDKAILWSSYLHNENFHRIWIVMTKAIMKWTPCLFGNIFFGITLSELGQSYDIDGLMQERHNCIAHALELHSLSTNPSIWSNQGNLMWGICQHIVGLGQDCSNSRALAMELLQSCTKPSICGMWLAQQGGPSYNDSVSSVNCHKMVALMIICPMETLDLTGPKCYHKK